MFTTLILAFAVAVSVIKDTLKKVMNSNENSNVLVIAIICALNPVLGQCVRVVMDFGYMMT